MSDQRQRIIGRLSARGMKKAANATALRHGVTLEDVAGLRQTRAVARARCAIWDGIRREYDLSYPEIGALFERDHTTVLNGIRRARDRQAMERLAS